MRSINGLKNILPQQSKRRCVDELAQSILTDLAHCYCSIYGKNPQDAGVLLARLDLLPDTLNYDSFDKRIDFTVAGTIISAEYPPLTYVLQGKQLSLSGRCSMLAKICGVDLYLQASYTGIVGDIARQKFSISIKPLLKDLYH